MDVGLCIGYFELLIIWIWITHLGLLWILVWTLGFELWILGFGPWALDFAFWVLHFDSKAWILDVGLWILDLGPRALDIAFGFLDFWVWGLPIRFVTLDCRLWILCWGFLT